VKSEAREAGIEERAYPHLLRHFKLSGGPLSIGPVYLIVEAPGTHLQLATTQIYAETNIRALGATERLPDEIDDDTLGEYFTLTKPDLEQVNQCRGPTNRLGFAVQLCNLPRGNRDDARSWADCLGLGRPE
jgi:Domain of unknown function (DUF4158)